MGKRNKSQKKSETMSKEVTPMRGMRLSLLARKANLSLGDIVNLLKSNGYGELDSSPNTKITIDWVRGINEVYPLGFGEDKNLSYLSEYPIKKLDVIPPLEKRKKTIEFSILFDALRRSYAEGVEIESLLKEAEQKVEETKKEAEEAKKELQEVVKENKALKSKHTKSKHTKSKHTKIAMHTVSQFYGDNKYSSLFSEDKIDQFKEATGLNLTNRPTDYGVILNQSQRRVFEGILNAFTNSNYEGDELIGKSTALREVYSDTVNSAKVLVNEENAPYRNIDAIPVVKLTQAKIIALSGYDLKKQRQGDKQDVIEALSFLATNQFCFYWSRLKRENGNPVKDKRGDFVKEEVMEVGTLFRIKTIRDQTGLLQYYEIQPSAPLLDQVNDYFLLVPNNWREEVKELTGRKADRYTHELLFWLRLQYEQIRRYNSGGGKNRKPKPFKITKSWEDVAIALKMPESMYKRNRPRSSKVIQNAYSVAIKLGYLIKVENNGDTDVLYLNEEYYPKPGELV
jgi:regulator of replication initiation timing